MVGFCLIKLRVLAQVVVVGLDELADAEAAQIGVLDIAQGCFLNDRDPLVTQMALREFVLKSLSQASHFLRRARFLLKNISLLH